ncbi:hypothetical protein FVEN_g5570 [Fusarium venenatum]|uniref:Uncharacterized protein n=1 Tax=Fusarium venenatum TaxID=56646 RepID=A0A2L2TE61_9HYPO|nr:uncharacterized protein FVRRES_08336 [Fusarium venenatum]KAG8356669.1 hypothetical protein FVEN_g5570 [Fusarium venenatum]KAH6965120.1 hypothetical protein EDB82DRAFT_528857 [Fusarium venenatum]CEI68259.1 unnamed protein product [Fusarium venenatum]
MPTEEQLRQLEAEDNSQQPVMLQIWLNEPSTVVFAADVWSSERAIAKPRPKAKDTKSRRKNVKVKNAAKAAWVLNGFEDYRSGATHQF